VLLLAVLAAALNGPKLSAAAAHCPQTPFAAAPIAGPIPANLTCAALEISGRIDRTSPTLDPAFEVAVAPSRLPANAPIAPDALIQGFDSQGRQLFAQPINASGDFHTYVALGAEATRDLARLRLTVGNAVVERVAAMHGEPAIEAVSVDDSRVLLAWNGTLFPALRVHESANGPLIGVGKGASTYDEITVATTSSRLTLEFSDGIHTYTRTIQVFGR
jgi:hypothetical protein